MSNATSRTFQSLGIALPLLLLTQTAFAADAGTAPFQVLVNDFSAVVNEANNSAPIWDRTATLLIVISSLIGIFGIAIATMQALKHHSIKYFIFALGFTVAVLEFLEKQVFDHDFRAYNNGVAEAKSMVGRISPVLDSAKAELARPGIDIGQIEYYTEKLNDLGTTLEALRQLNLELSKEGLIIRLFTSVDRLTTETAYAFEPPKKEVRASVRANAVTYKEAAEVAKADARQAGTRKIEQMVDTQLANASDYQRCLLDDSARQALVRSFERVFSDTRVSDAKYVNGSYEVSADLVLPPDADKLVKDSIDQAVYAAAQRPNNCSASVSGLYTGTWQSDDYKASGQVTITLREVGDQIQATVEHMTGSRYRLSNFSGTPVQDNARIEIPKARGDSTEVKVAIENGTIDGQYKFHFGWFNLLTDNGTINLRKVDTIPD